MSQVGQGRGLFFTGIHYTNPRRFCIEGGISVTYALSDQAEIMKVTFAFIFFFLRCSQKPPQTPQTKELYTSVQTLLRFAEYIFMNLNMWSCLILSQVKVSILCSGSPWPFISPATRSFLKLKMSLIEPMNFCIQSKYSTSKPWLHPMEKPCCYQFFSPFLQ